MMKVEKHNAIEDFELELPSTVEDLCRFMEQQKEEMTLQLVQFEHLALQQLELTGIDPVQEDLVCLCTGVKRAARRELVTAHAARTLLGVYSFKDTLTAKEVQELGSLVGATPYQIRTFFTEQRKCLRGLLSVNAGPVQRRSKAAGRGEALSSLSSKIPRRLGRAANATSAASRVALAANEDIQISEAADVVGRARLTHIRKAENGTGDDPTDGPWSQNESKSASGAAAGAGGAEGTAVGGSGTVVGVQASLMERVGGKLVSEEHARMVLELMQQESFVSGREELAQSLVEAAEPPVLDWLTGQGVVRVLAQWVAEAITDEQTSLLRVLLEALLQLPGRKVPVSHFVSAALPLKRAAKYCVEGEPITDVSKLAMDVLLVWNKATDGRVSIKQQVDLRQKRSNGIEAVGLKRERAPDGDVGLQGKKLKSGSPLIGDRGRLGGKHTKGVLPLALKNGSGPFGSSLVSVKTEPVQRSSPRGGKYTRPRARMQLIEHRSVQIIDDLTPTRSAFADDPEKPAPTFRRSLTSASKPPNRSKPTSVEDIRKAKDFERRQLARLAATTPPPPADMAAPWSEQAMPATSAAANVAPLGSQHPAGAVDTPADVADAALPGGKGETPAGASCMRKDLTSRFSFQRSGGREAAEEPDMFPERFWKKRARPLAEAGSGLGRVVEKENGADEALASTEVGKDSVFSQAVCTVKWRVPEYAVLAMEIACGEDSKEKSLRSKPLPLEHDPGVNYCPISDHLIHQIPIDPKPEDSNTPEQPHSPPLPPPPPNPPAWLLNSTLPHPYDQAQNETVAYQPNPSGQSSHGTGSHGEGSHGMSPHGGNWGSSHGSESWESAHRQSSHGMPSDGRTWQATHDGTGATGVDAYGADSHGEGAHVSESHGEAVHVSGGELGSGARFVGQEPTMDEKLMTLLLGTPSEEIEKMIQHGSLGAGSLDEQTRAVVVSFLQKIADAKRRQGPAEAAGQAQQQHFSGHFNATNLVMEDPATLPMSFATSSSHLLPSGATHQPHQHEIPPPVTHQPLPAMHTQDLPAWQGHQVPPTDFVHPGHAHMGPHNRQQSTQPTLEIPSVSLSIIQPQPFQTRLQHNQGGRGGSAPSPYPLHQEDSTHFPPYQQQPSGSAPSPYTNHLQNSATLAFPHHQGRSQGGSAPQSFRPQYYGGAPEGSNQGMMAPVYDSVAGHTWEGGLGATMEPVPNTGRVHRFGNDDNSRACFHGNAHVAPSRGSGELGQRGGGLHDSMHNHGPKGRHRGRGPGTQFGQGTKWSGGRGGRVYSRG